MISTHIDYRARWSGGTLIPTARIWSPTSLLSRHVGIKAQLVAARLVVSCRTNILHIARLDADVARK